MLQLAFGNRPTEIQNISACSIAMSYETERSGFDFRQGQSAFFLKATSYPVDTSLLRSKHLRRSLFLKADQSKRETLTTRRTGVWFKGHE